MDSFRLCETYLLYIKLFVGNQSAISQLLGGLSYRFKLRFVFDLDMYPLGPRNLSLWIWWISRV